ncbi:MAG: four-carbon acid sugar kinase family protein, partial [Gammaproteobacteria bacterium]
RRTRLFLDVPDLQAVGPALDAVGVATGLRAMDAPGISAALHEMAPKLARLKARFVHYKVCSTFDSSPQIGSIGAAVLALREHLEPALVAVVGGQPSLGRYCHFGNLFAAAADGEVYRIDRHPVMRHHPVTPMGEADLRLHLGAQRMAPIRLIDRAARAEGATSLAHAIRQAMAAGERKLLFDVGVTEDLLVIGEALRQLEASRPILLVGASSVAESLTLSDPRPASIEKASPRAAPRQGPILVFAGSRSPVTEAQIASSKRFYKIPIEPGALALPDTLNGIAATCIAALLEGRNVLAYLLAGREHGLSSFRLAHASAELVAAIVASVTLRSLGVAGG